MFGIVKLLFPMEILPHIVLKFDNQGIGIVSTLSSDEIKRSTSPPMLSTLGDWQNVNQGAVISARLALVSLSVNYVSVSDKTSMG